MDFHGINASVRTGIYSMVPLTPAFPVREKINVSSSAAAAYAGPQSMGRKGGGKLQLYKRSGNVLKSKTRETRKRRSHDVNERRFTGHSKPTGTHK